MDSTSFELNNQATRATFNNLEAIMTRLSNEKLHCGLTTYVRILFQLLEAKITNRPKMSRHKLNTCLSINNNKTKHILSHRLEYEKSNYIE